MRHFVDVEINHTVHNTTQNVETPNDGLLNQTVAEVASKKMLHRFIHQSIKGFCWSLLENWNPQVFFQRNNSRLAKKSDQKLSKCEHLRKKICFWYFVATFFSPTSFPQKGWRKFPRRGGNTHMLTWNCSPCSRRKESGLDLGRHDGRSHGRMYMSDLHLSMRRWCFRNPKANQSLDGAKTLVQNGINYQLQLVH